jgi:hypothetical protein
MAGQAVFCKAVFAAMQHLLQREERLMCKSTRTGMAIWYSPREHVGFGFEGGEGLRGATERRGVTERGEGRT